MSDSDQSSSERQDLSNIVYRELMIVCEACIQASERFHKVFKHEIAWQDIFLLSLLSESSGLDQSITNFLSNSRVFQRINPIWDVSLVSSSCQNLRSVDDEKKYSSMYFILDMLKGRLNLQFRGDYFLVVNSLHSNQELYALVVAEIYPELALKILVCFQEGGISQDGINSFITEFTLNQRVLEKFENIIFEQNFFEIDNFCYRPGVILGLKTHTRKRESKGTEGIKPNIQVNNQENPQIHAPQVEIIENSLVEELLPDSSVPNKEKHYLEAEQVLEYFNDSSEIRQYLDSSLPFVQSKGEENDSFKEFQNFKNSLLENASKFQELEKIRPLSWAALALKWHENELQNQNKILDIYESPDVVWKLTFDEKLLRILKNIKEDEFFQYFTLFFRYGLGFAITNTEFFFNLNKKNDEDFIFTIVELPDSNLKSVLAVLKIDYSDQSARFIPKIHFSDFCDSESLEEKISYLKVSLPHVKIKQNFGKKGIKSIIVIEKDLKITPIPGLTSRIEPVFKTIQFLYSFESQSEISIYLVSADNQTIEASALLINQENQKMQTFLFTFEVSLPSDSEYWIQMSFTLNDQTLLYVDKQSVRKLPAARSVFLFNFEFQKHIKNFSTKAVPGSALNEPFAQLFFYISNMSLPEKGEDYESLIFYFNSAFNKKILRESIDTHYQNSILSIVENYLDLISEMDQETQLEILYFMLLLLSAIQIYPFEGKISDSSLNCLMSIIESCDGKFLLVFRAKNWIQFAIKGLIKSFVLCKHQGKEFRTMFDLLIDYRTLRGGLKAYLEIHQDRGLEVSKEEISEMLNYCLLFTKKKKDSMILKILESVREPLNLFSHLTHPVFHDFTNEGKKKVFREALQQYQPSLEDFGTFLKTFKEQDAFKLLFDQHELSKMIENVMKIASIHSDHNFEVFKEIIEIIKVENQLGSMNVNLETIFNELLDNSSFSKCMKYFLLYPESISGIFETWTIKLFSSFELIDALKIIDQEIELIPKDFRDPLSLIVFEKAKISNLLDLIQLIDELLSDSMKSAYKSTFKARHFKGSNFRSTFLELVKDKNKKNLKNCDLYHELLEEAESLICPSDEDLAEKLLNSPTKEDLLYEYLSDEDLVKNSSIHQRCYLLFKNFENSLKDQSLLVSKINLIQRHSISQKEAFIHYIRLIFQDTREQKHFLEILNENSKKVKDFNIFLKFMKNFALNLVPKFPELIPLVEVYQNFERNREVLTINECKIPSELQKLNELVLSKKCPVNSKIFMNIVMRNSDKNIKNFENTLVWNINLYETIILTISSERIQKLTVGNFWSYFPEFLMEELSKEITCIHEFFDNYILLNYFELEQLLKEFFSLINNYYRIKSVVYLIGKSSRLLDLPIFFSKYSKIEDCYLIPEIVDLLKSLSKEEIFSLSHECISIMKIFFRTVVECENITSLACSTAEEDLNFWRECFVSNMDNKGLTLEIIENFILITSFFSKIKVFSDSFVNYARNIMNLLNYEVFANIFEIITDCNKSAGLLDDYSKSLNNQEQIKLNRIKAICRHSIIRIKRTKDSYSAEIFPQNPEQGESKGLNFTEIKELKDRALLSKYIIDQKIEKEQESRKNDLMTYKYFVEFVEYLCAFTSTLTQLSQTLFRLTLHKEKEYILENSEYFDLIQDSNFFILLLNDEWKKFYKESTKRSYLINFLNGESLYKIDQFFYNRSEDNLIAIIGILKYMQKVPPEATREIFKRPESMEQRLIYIENFLDELPDKIIHPKFSFERFDHYPQVPGSVIIAETKDFFIGVLTIYTNYRKMLPRSDLVLFCNYSTKWEEIKLFLNRCFLNTNKEIYTLVNPENLTFSNQLKIESKALKRFDQQESDFYLAIVTAEPNCKLVSNLSNHLIIPVETVQHYQFLDERDVHEIVKTSCINLLVVKSAYSGLGKSRYIRKIMNSGNSQNCYEYTIPAAFDLEELHRKISILGLIPDSKFRFNLNYLTEPERFNEFIFSLALFSMSSIGKFLITLHEKSQVFIEVANTFNDKLFKSVTFLKFLEVHEIHEFSITEIRFSNDLNYVCKYLRAVDDLSINQVNLEYSKNEKSRKEENHLILNKYFIPMCEGFPNFHQLTTFTKVLTKLFKNFESSMFSVEIINYQRVDYEQLGINFLENVRSCILQSLIETSKEFTSRCVKSVKINQDNMIGKAQKDEKDEIVLADCSIKWENSNHFIMIFDSDGDFMNIYRSPEKVPENIRNLIVSQSIIEQRIKYGLQDLECNEFALENGRIEDYNMYSSEQLIEKLISFYSKYSLKSSFEELRPSEEMKAIRLSELSQLGYILTPDNFLKMNLIFIRCISKLPLIIMGETGCGKTSLLRFFVEEILREKLMIIYIHSGVTNQDILNHITQANEEANSTKKERVWVFFDEFNTSDLIGDIVLLLCDKKYTIPLNPKLVFVGACNPYRVKKSINFKENVGIKKKNLNNYEALQLVHTVKPLPDKAIEFVWDFGVLRPSEIKNYISSMLIKNQINPIQLFTQLITTAHEYFQNSEDVSSVSLRDINRFTQLYNWFHESIKARKSLRVEKPLDEYLEVKKMLEKTIDLQELFPGLLAFFHCYYLRISCRDDRMQFMYVVVSQIQEFDERLDIPLIENLIKLEQLELMSRMNLTEGIALNMALMENIFAIVPCVLNKIPVFICGKPGCSKSLAIQIISSSMRGIKSSDPYFFTLPELQIVSFQGSESCTSEGIQEVFNSAEKLLNRKRAVLPVVLFDEIGLAEVSRYNPLKILHKLLEFENCKVAFIAISNWRLDASKMNRALYLARPDPEKSDLISTAKILFQSFGETKDSMMCMQVIEKVAKGYSKLKKAMSLENYADFYGLRDFYHTIKFISRKVRNSGEEDLALLTQEAIIRNFNGLEGSCDTLPTYFSEAFSGLQLKASASKLISDNLEDSQGRYLMIICAQDVSEYLKSAIIDNHLPNYKFILGSTFEKEMNEEASRFKILSDIIGYMEQGVPIVLQNMDVIYSSLYDLFNQNFIVLGKSRKYCRVALGAHFNPRCFVHDNFKVVVFLDNDRKVLEETDAPLLNRFEKHFVLLKDLIEPEFLELSKEIINWVESIFNIKGKDNRLQPGSIFPCFSYESINLMIQMFKDLPKKQIMQKIQNFLIKNSSFDLVFLSKINSFDQQEMKEIVEKWRNIHLIEFREYLIKLSDRQRYLTKNKTAKVICSTFDSFGTDFLKKQFSEVVQFEKCCNFKSETELRQSYQKFVDSKKKTVFLLELDSQKESKHFKFVVSFLDSLSQEIHAEDRESVKNICLLVRLIRCDDQRKPILLIKGWRYRMFDDLSLNSVQQMEKVLNKDLSEIIENGELYNFNEHYEEITQKAFDSINFLSPTFSFDHLQNVKKSLIEIFSKDINLRHTIEQKILEIIKKSKTRQNQDWISQLFVSESIVRSAKSVKDALVISISQKFLLEYTKLIVACEKKSGLSSLLKCKNNQSNYLTWTQIFGRLQTNDIEVHLKYDSNNLNYLVELSLPFIYADYKMLKVKYSELLSSEVPKERFASELKEFHLNKSIWLGSVGVLYEDPTFVDMFINDFIEITLMERGVDQRFTDFITQIFRELIDKLPIDEKIKELFESQMKIFNLNSIFTIFSKYQKIEALESIVDMFKSSVEENEIRINFMIELIIENISPSYTAEFKANDISAYSKDISSLLSFLSSFPKPSNFCMMEFWSELSKLNCMPLMLDIAFMMQGKSHDYLFTDQTAHNLLGRFSIYPQLESSKSNNFRVFYMTQLLERNVNMIEIVASEIKTPETWKYSGPLIETLLKCSELKEKLDNFESDYADKEKFSIIFENKNQHLKYLSELIENLEFSDQFCVMLVDKVRLLDFKVKILSALRNCSAYLEVFESLPSDGEKLKKIVAAARIKFYLYQFMSASNPDGVVQENFVDDLGKVLIQKETLDYELYCLKALKKIANVCTLKLNDLCSRTRYTWRINYKEIGVRTVLEVFPYLESVSSMYKSFLIKILSLVDNEKELNEIFLKPKNDSEVFALGLAFMNSVYFMYTRPNFNKDPYARWYSLKEGLISQKFGQAFSKLLKFFIENFPDGSILHLNHETSTKSFHLAMTVSYVILVGVVFSSVPNQFSKQFFDTNGRFYNNFKENASKMFFIGAERIKIHDYLNYMKNNFEMVKNKNFAPAYSKGGSYVCSNDCDYLYIINNCGGAMVEIDCPFCRKRIGGTGHQFVVRPGHRNLSDAEAVDFLEKKVTQYNRLDIKGFADFSTSIPLASPRKLRSEISFILLNIFTNSMFYFLSVSGLYQEGDLSSIYNTGNLPVNKIIQEKIIMNFTELDNKHKSEEIIYWILSTINEFKEIILSSRADPSDQNLRDEIELKFESKIQEKSFQDHCNFYKLSLKSQREPSIIINYIEELEIPADPSFKNYQLFRFTTVPSWDTLKDAFSLSVFEGKYLILSQYIKRFDEMSNLEHFWNILVFARDMIDECSFTVSRATANILTISEFLQKRPQLKRKFENFRRSWSGLKLVLRFDCKDFDRIEVTGDTPIGYFLVDTDINSLGIRLAACLRNLAEFQNNIVAMVHTEEAPKRSPIFSISSEDVFFISPEKLDTVIQSCSNNCLEYGRGPEIVYDWERVDLYIKQYAEKAKLLDSENLPTVQYQFELLNARSKYAGIISEIRERVPQLNLTEEEVKTITKRINSKAFKLGVETQIVWKQAHTWLEKLFLTLRHAKSIEHELIGNVKGVNARFDNDFRAFEVFGELPNEKCINIYEISEFEVFEEVSKMINEQYKINYPDRNEGKTLLLGFCENVCSSFDTKNQGSGKKVLQECGKVLRRIILRLLTANTDPKFRIFDYFGIEDYWNLSFIRDAELAAEMFPQEFNLEHAIYVEKELATKIKELCLDLQYR